MKKITFLFLISIAISSLKTNAQDLSISFESTEGFTLGEINGQNGWVTNQTYSPFVNIVDTQSTDGTNALYLEDDPNGPLPNNGITGAVSPAINFNDVTFTIDLFVESGPNPSEFDVILQSVASNALTSRVVFFDGDILVVDAVPDLQFVTAGSYTTDVWFELKVEHDFVNGTIEYSIDNTEVYTGNLVNGTNIDQMLLFSSFNQTGIYADNINFTIPTMRAEEFNSPSIDVYPNPTTDIITINTIDNHNIHGVSIYDLNGKKFESHLNPDHSINVDFLSTGTYLLVIETDKGTKSSKFVKN